MALFNLCAALTYSAVAVDVASFDAVACLGEPAYDPAAADLFAEAVVFRRLHRKADGPHVCIFPSADDS